MTRKQTAWIQTVLGIVALTLTNAGTAQAQQFVQAPPGGTTAASGNGAPTVYIEQHLNAQVPLDVELRDESNQPVKFGDLLNKRPAILVFPFYKCAGSCIMEMDDLNHALNQIRYTAGKDFDVIVVSIDSNETFSTAQAKKKDYLEKYGRPGAEQGWHVLTGPEESIQRLTRSVGFHFARDPQTNAISHPIGLMFLTGEGKISHYLFGLPFASRDVNLALVDASEHKIGSLSEYVSLLCSHYDAATGKYGVAIERIIKIACGGTVLIMAAFIVAMLRLEKRRGLLETPDGETPTPPTGAGETA